MSYEDFLTNKIKKPNNIIILLENQDITDVIISKYNENVSKINLFKNVYLYDKNPINSENFYKYVKPDVHYEHLKNVGRESHTYLHHIIKNYDNLNDINIFLSGSTFDENPNHKLEIFNKLVLISNKTKNTVFFKNKHYILELFYNFKLKKHKTTSIENNIFDDCHELQQYKGNYKDWYIDNFGYRSVNYGSFGGILVLHKRHILQHPKKYYEHFLSYLDNHNSPEVGHYLERAWGAVFYPIGDNCIINYSDVRDIFDE